MEILLVLTVGAMCICCFFVGAKVGQTVAKGEPIQTPDLNPVHIIREREERRAQKEEMDKIETILSNIDAYDGTPFGQKDVPW